MQQERNRPDTWENIRTNIVPTLAVSAAIVSIISSWVYFKFTLNAHEVRISALEAKQELNDSQWAKVQSDISGINAKMDIVLKKLNY